MRTVAPYYYPSYYYPNSYYYSNYYPTNYYPEDYYYADEDYSVSAPSYTYAAEGSATVAAVQEQLARAGYYHGPIDGIIGPRTRAAIVAFERRHDLPVYASINQPLLVTLGLA